MNAGEKVRDAEAWFSERSIADSLNPRYLTHDALKHAMTIVRAWLARDVPAEDRIPTAAEIVDEIERARDVPAPAGRDLTAQDIRDSYLLLMEQGAPENENRQFVADYLSRIARPSGGVGQPDTAELWQTIRDYLDENDLGDELLVRLGTSGQFAAEPVSLTYPDGACVQCGHPAAAHRPDSGQCMKCTGKRACFAPGIAEEVADRSPRTWSLPAPPPDDVTVVHVEAGDEVLRCVREGYHWRDESGGSLYGFGELLDLGDVVEGEPPAPEPQELPRFERGFYRLARDLDPDNGYEIVPAGLVFVSRVDEDGTAFVNTADVSTRTTVAALAAAGAERMEDE